jgi:hypothetical protein
VLYATEPDEECWVYAKKFSHFDDGMGKPNQVRSYRREDCNVRRRRWTRRRCLVQESIDTVIPLDTSTDMFAVRLHNGVQWSSPINMGAFAFQKDLHISLIRRAQPLLLRPAALFEFCVNTEVAPHPFEGWTTIVTIQPYYRIYNCVQDKSFCVRQTKTKTHVSHPDDLQCIRIDPGKASALYWYNVQSPSLLHIVDEKFESGALRVDTDNEFPVQIKNEVYLIRVYVLLSTSTLERFSCSFSLTLSLSHSLFLSLSLSLSLSHTHTHIHTQVRETNRNSSRASRGTHVSRRERLLIDDSLQTSR